MIKLLAPEQTAEGLAHNIFFIRRYVGDHRAIKLIGLSAAGVEYFFEFSFEGFATRRGNVSQPEPYGKRLSGGTLPVYWADTLVPAGSGFTALFTPSTT